MGKAFKKEELKIFILSGFVSGIYPFLFLYSNNFALLNSFQLFFYYLAYFVLSPIVLFAFVYVVVSNWAKISKYKFHILFALIIIVTSTLLVKAMYLGYRKKLLLLVYFIAILIAFKAYRYYKKLLLIIAIVSIIPISKNIINIYENLKPQKWRVIPDDLKQTVFKEKPNIYVIQPDGYVSNSVLSSSPYNYTSNLFSYLETKKFKVYNNFRSNYPASLASNVSLFSMKHHKFNGSMLPTLEGFQFREIICGDNPVINILKNNGYYTNFIVHDEYFQQNLCDVTYDSYNIKNEDIPISFTNLVERNVLEDLKAAIKNNASLQQPKFYFVEKLMPHHVHYLGSLTKDRDWYISRLEKANQWVKKTINLIEKHDNKAIIVILADHGGWLGVKNYTDMYTTKNKDKIISVYSTLAAVKWNGYLLDGYDTNLTTHVNFFRVLFANLSKNRKLLNTMEDNSSYNIYKNGFVSRTLKLIDNDGNCVNCTDN